MDKDAEKIQKFIKTHAKKYREPHQYFSQESRLFIERIFHYMEKGSLSYEKHSAKIMKKTTDKMPTGKYYDLLEDSVKYTIQTNMCVFTTIEFEIGSTKKRTFHIHMCFLSQADSVKYTDEWLRKIYIWLYVAHHFSVQTCSNVLSMYLYFTDMKKELPEIDDQPMTTEHANTAFTFACNMPGSTTNNEIYIYRKEEWFKVLIHESFHSFGLDFAAMDTTAIQQRICNSGDIYQVPCTDLRFYESYTEMWAELIQCMFVANEFAGVPTEKIGYVENLVYGLEAPFSAFQATKVLEHFGLVYEDLFDKGAASQYTEKTPVFAYYIIKSVFMNHADEFICWCMQNNQGSLQFKKTQTNIQRLADLLKSLAKQENYLNKMDKMDKIVDGPINILLASTMRMTCVSAI